MGIRGRALPHTVTVLTPTETTNAYGAVERTYPTTGRSVLAFVQPIEAEESGDDRVTTDLTMFTNDTVAHDDRVAWQGTTYDVVARDVWDIGTVHHCEVRLREVAG